MLYFYFDVKHALHHANTPYMRKTKKQLILIKHYKLVK